MIILPERFQRFAVTVAFVPAQRCIYCSQRGLWCIDHLFSRDCSVSKLSGLRMWFRSIVAPTVCLLWAMAFCSRARDFDGRAIRFTAIDKRHSGCHLVDSPNKLLLSIGRQSSNTHLHFKHHTCLETSFSNYREWEASPGSAFLQPWCCSIGVDLVLSSTL